MTLNNKFTSYIKIKSVEWLEYPKTDGKLLEESKTREKAREEFHKEQDLMGDYTGKTGYENVLLSGDPMIDGWE